LGLLLYDGIDRRSERRGTGEVRQLEVFDESVRNGG
jgi:hypothetical protein